MTHYEILGVAPRATPAEIRVAFHQQARRWHPDLHVAGGVAAADAARIRMSAINVAWTVLSDPGRRRAYDLQLAPRAAASATPTSSGWREPSWTEVDEDEWWSERERWVPSDAGRRSRPAALRAAPVLLMAAGVVSAVLWVVLRFQLMLAVSLVAWVLGGAGLLVLPMLTMSDAKKHSKI